MQYKYDIDAVNQCLRDLLEVNDHLHLIAVELTYYLENDHLFGGITMVFGGDFCQTLPVVPKETCQQVVVVSLCRGNLWRNIKFFLFQT